MPGCARKEIVRDGEIATYHCWSRCVQRAWLCGDDPYSGQNYDHRRVWIKSLLEYQACIFAVDIGNYSILSNHQHIICRTRPDIVEGWSDEEVAWRWKMAWPRWEDGRWMREPTDEEIQELLARPQHMQAVRRNLSSLSWFMARSKEPIARMANAEAKTKGHFYESRYGSRELVDDGGILCCSIYVDLNQLKAGMSTSLAESDNSAIQDRIHAWLQREAEKSVKKFHKQKDSPDDQLEPGQVQQLLADCHLSPIDQRGPLMLPDGSSAVAVPNKMASEETEEPTESPDPSTEVTVERRASRPGKPPTRKIHRRLIRRRRPRASDNAILSMPFQQYLQIAEWTAQQLLGSGTDPPPLDLESLLRAKGLDPLNWHSAVDNFADWFHHAVGGASHLTDVLQRRDRRWIHGIARCRDAFT